MNGSVRSTFKKKTGQGQKLLQHYQSSFVVLPNISTKQYSLNMNILETWNATISTWSGSCIMIKILSFHQNLKKLQGWYNQHRHFDRVEGNYKEKQEFIFEKIWIDTLAMMARIAWVLFLNTGSHLLNSIHHLAGSNQGWKFRIFVAEIERIWSVIDIQPRFVCFLLSLLCWVYRERGNGEF